MVGTARPERVLGVIASGLLQTSSVYVRESDGRLVFRGVRPGPQWEGHGTFARKLFTLQQGRLVRITVYKQRWRRQGTTQTCHSRPPDDLASVWFCSLIVAVSLWSWICGDVGLHHREPVLPSLEQAPSARTVQRWLRRALRHAEETATALRRAVIERSEPRPMESHVGGGLSPPHRRWGGPGALWTLHSGLSLLFDGATAFDVPVSLLLAEARGRQHVRTDNWIV